jgi:hypothetical protein
MSDERNNNSDRWFKISATTKVFTVTDGKVSFGEFIDCDPGDSSESDRWRRFRLELEHQLRAHYGGNVNGTGEMYDEDVMALFKPERRTEKKTSASGLDS